MNQAETWKPLYRAGAIAAILAALLFRRNIGAEVSLLTGVETIPTTVADWYAPLQANRFVGLCFARLPGDVPESIRTHFDTPLPKLYCAMGVSGSPRVLGEVIEIVNNLEIQSVIVTTIILPGQSGNGVGRVLLTPHAPVHRVNPLADIAITHGWAGTVQTAIHAGIPLVGIPMHLEQNGNLSLVTRQGAGLMLSKWNLTQRSLSRALDQVLGNSSLCENMMHLKSLQDKLDGPAIAAREIVNFLGASSPKMETTK